jgi:hypothetical protein
MKKFRDIPMKVILKNSVIILSSLILAACGSSDNSASNAVEEEHSHSLLISQIDSPTLSVLEEGTAENLDDDAQGGVQKLLLADNGEAAAIVTAGSVEFVAAHHEEEGVEDEHELPEINAFSISGSNIKVANSNGHFSVLVDGSTQFVPYEALEDETPAAEDVSYSVVETYPALLLHESETYGLLTLVFDGVDATVYAGSALEGTQVMCTGAINTAQYGEFALISCGASNYSLHVEGETVEIIGLTAITTPVDWKARNGVFVGLGDDDHFYIREINAENLVIEGPISAPASMCTWGIDSLSADIFALTVDTLTIFDHEGESHSITLDETQGAYCDDLRLATANKAVFVIDNQAQVLYEIDKEEDAAEYHIHGREELSVNDVASAVVFHEVGTEAEAHDH